MATIRPLDVNDDASVPGWHERREVESRTGRREAVEDGRLALERASVLSGLRNLEHDLVAIRGRNVEVLIALARQWLEHPRQRVVLGQQRGRLICREPGRHDPGVD